MEKDAKCYDELSQPQYESGRKFINDLNISSGNKVLDIGCGTGDLTKYIADIVGSDGQVFGIDPDDERIKIAKEKFKEVSNLQFHVGSTVTGFPHDGEQYYDLHITTHAFHWFPPDQKKLYIQKAYQSLKPGGKLTTLCLPKFGPEGNDQLANMGVYPLSTDGYQKLFQEEGSFANVEVKQAVHKAFFKSKDMFKRWAKASTHHEYEGLDPEFVKGLQAKLVTFQDDGTVTLIMPNVCIIAVKE
mgnify:CR=1 FL=1